MLAEVDPDPVSWTWTGMGVAMLRLRDESASKTQIQVKEEKKTSWGRVDPRHGHVQIRVVSLDSRIWRWSHKAGGARDVSIACAGCVQSEAHVCWSRRQRGETDEVSPGGVEWQFASSRACAGLV